MKLYIAGSSDDRERVQQVITYLELCDHEITYNWLPCFNEPVKDYLQFARDDIAGIHSADIVIFIFEKPLIYRGTYTELGLAIAFRKPIIILGKEADKNIFTRLKGVSTCYSLVDVIELIDEIGENK